MIQRYHATGTLYHPPSGKVLLDHRSDDAPSEPGRWELFGGGSEPQDGGDPLATWRRELAEELGIRIAPEQARFVYARVTGSGVRRYVYYSAWPTLSTAFTLTESQGVAWFTFDEALVLPNITKGATMDVAALQQLIASQRA